MVVGPGIKTGMPINTSDPSEVGADRIVDAVAAYNIYGGPVIVTDFGTATMMSNILKTQSNINLISQLFMEQLDI